MTDGAQPDEDEKEFTPDERAMMAVGQMIGIKRADMRDGGERWTAAVTEMALQVAMHRLGITEIEFSAREWIDATPQHAFAMERSDGLTKWNLALMSMEQVEAQRQATMAAMLGGAINEDPT